MQTFDIIFGIFSLILVILGIKRGFIEEIMRLVAIIAGFIGALIFYRQFIPKIAFLHLPSEMAAAASFIIILLGVMIGVTIIGKLLKKVISLTMMGWADRLCGGCFGLLKAFFLGWIFVIAVMALPFPDFAASLKASQTFSFFSTISPVLKNKFPSMGVLPSHKSSPSSGALPQLGDSFNKLWNKNAAPSAAHRQKNKPSKLPSVNSDSI
jgi:membrane protein required for colicin V production